MLIFLGRRRIKHFHFERDCCFFGGPDTQKKLKRELLNLDHSWKRHLSKQILIKTALLLYQFTESEGNFLLLETQLLRDGGKAGDT